MSRSSSKTNNWTDAHAVSQGTGPAEAHEGRTPEDPWVHQIIGNYRLLKRIGEGATAIVYRASHIQLDRLYALKILHPMIATQPGMRERFLREAKTAAQLEHENIIFINDFAIDATFGPYMVMEYLEGMTLKEVLEAQGIIPLHRILAISLQVCNALSAAHNHGIIHRDLKPENIFLERREDGSERAKILDFGIARLAQSTSSITGDGKLIGTPLYMSPEQCRGQFPLSPASDIYSFGITLYEMLTGAPPFQSDSPHKLIIDHFLATPPNLDYSFPEELRQLQRELLAKEPEERPQSFAQLAVRLRESMEATQTSNAPMYATLEEAPIPQAVLDAISVKMGPASSVPAQGAMPPLPIQNTELYHPSVPDSRDSLTPPPGPYSHSGEMATQEQLPSIRKRGRSGSFLSPRDKTSVRVPNPHQQPVVVKRRETGTHASPSHDPLIHDLEQLFSTPSQESDAPREVSLSSTAWDVASPRPPQPKAQPTYPPLQATPSPHSKARPNSDEHPFFQHPETSTPSTPTNPQTLPSRVSQTPALNAVRRTQAWSESDPIIELQKPKDTASNPLFQRPPTSPFTDHSSAPSLQAPATPHPPTERGPIPVIAPKQHRITGSHEQIPGMPPNASLTPEELEMALFNLDAATEIDLSQAPRRSRRRSGQPKSLYRTWWFWGLLLTGLGLSSYLVYLILSLPALPPLLFV